MSEPIGSDSTPSVGNERVELTVNDVQSLQLTIARLEQELAAVQGATASANATAAAAAVRPEREHASRDIKLGNPTPFAGKTSELRAFTTQLKMKFAAESRLFDDEQKKVMYAGYHLAGKAFDWFSASVEAATDGLAFATFGDLEEALKTNYGDPNEKRTYADALALLRQTSRISVYDSEFLRLSSRLDFDKQALKDKYYRGLAPVIKDELTKFDESDSFEDLRALAIRIDQRLWARKVEQRRETSQDYDPYKLDRVTTFPNYKPRAGFVKTNSGFSAPRERTYPTSNRLGMEPMDLSVVSARTNGRDHGQRKISDAERQRRFREKLCLRCGDPGHYRTDCPVGGKPTGVAAASAAPSLRFEVQQKNE